MKEKWWVTMLMLICVLFLVVCGGSGGNSAQGDSMDSIVRVTMDWPNYLDPAVGSDESSSMTHINVYSPLVYPQTDGSIVPHIATDWTVSDDGLTYTFKIRNDVKFHSGNLLKASDVVYSMNRMLEIGEGYAYLYIGVVKECTAPDTTTVVMKLENTFGPFIATLVRLMVVEEALVTKHYDKNVDTYGSKGDYGKGWMLTNDAGSGPYKTKECKLDEYYLGERFDDYFLGWQTGAPQYFRISGMTDPVAVRTAIANKELEITDNRQPLENYETMATMEGVEIAAYMSGDMCQLMMNTKVAPTDDIHFRKAIAYAFDYETVMNSIYPGAGYCRGPVASVIPGADASITPYGQDYTKAKAELAQSKYANDPNKKITLTWCAEVPEQEKISLLILANLKELGIDVEISKKPFGQMIADAQRVETTPNISIVNFAPSYFEAGSILKTRYHSSSCGSWEQMEWLQDARLDRMIEDALSSTDRTQRFVKYNEIQRYIYDLCPTVWMFNWLTRYAVHSDYVTWEALDAARSGQTYLLPMGYAFDASKMKVDVSKR